jgi:4-hydroxythreonine-4-phosphate dehydrogenase
MGDPAGIGPELCLRLLAEPQVLGVCEPIIFGDRHLLARVADRLQWRAPAEESVHHIRGLKVDDVRPGIVDAECGRYSFRCVEQAIDAAMTKKVAALCTMPINKESWHEAGISYPGHTELLVEKTATIRYCMMLTAPEVTCSLATTHVGFADVPKALTSERIAAALELTHAMMLKLRGRPPRLVVLGLNPHAGEHGLFGHGEEERIIAPVIAEARSKGWHVDGPMSADTAFVAGQRSSTDAYICMYHDQGLIPLKTLAFDSAANVTLGLPIVRTSPDHGTAYDIAWTGTARADSAVQAMLLAAQLVS